jgi:hypothetical protein
MIRRTIVISILVGLPLPAAAAKLSVLARDDAALPRKLWPEGKPVTSLRWRDRNGLNIAAFSTAEPGSRTARPDRPRPVFLHVLHFVKRDGKWRLLRRVKDFVHTCGLDLTAEFIKPSLSVTDLDDDGKGELTFAYRLGCRGDVSPITLKLLLLEDGAKYILRGSTLVQGEGGKYRIDRSFRRAPVFLRHAKRVWKKIVREF